MPDLSVGNYILPETPGVLKTTVVNRKDLSSESLKTVTNRYDKRASISLLDTCRNLSGTLQPFAPKKGVHSSTKMISAGLPYTNNDDTARCNTCGLEVSGWTSDMEPFTIHKQRSPTCTFVLSMLTSEKISTDSPNKPIEIASTSNVVEHPQPQVQTDTYVANPMSRILVEVNTLKQIRKRTFSHWPHRSSPSTSQMIQAGFFNCNVGDRVICIYCNLVCQQWTPNNEDPCEVHKTLSPKCPYVIAMLITPQTSSISVINEASASTNPFPSQTIVQTVACNPNYIEIPKRAASFSTWPNENLPSVDDLVRAGFFFTGTKTIVTCFYCSGSLQNWGANDNPMVEHARWFPHCAYAKQLCGVELHQKIQESKRAQQERARTNNAENRSEAGSGNSNYSRLLIPDESTLSRLVAARLDLPISQSLLDRKFKLSVIKRCWEDQLRLKHDDFICDSDLLMACTILQKQIEHIDGKKENIIIPSVAMKKDREQKQVALDSFSTSSPERNDREMTVPSGLDIVEKRAPVASEEMKNLISSSMENITPNCDNSLSPANPCVICLKEEKRLACIPCGHLATCASCGQSVRSCPICHRGIDAFVRIYL